MRRKRQRVVAIGASAGGLEAMVELLPELRANGSTRYIVAQHMARTGHTELVVRVLGRHTALPVVEATDGVSVQPDHIYVLPSGVDGWYEEGRLHLREPSANSLSTPSVDLLLTSIARSCGDDAVAIVLSGAGSDGLAGCREVKRAGGTVWVQCEDSSAISGMTGAVRRAGIADAELTPRAIAHRINGLTPPVPAPTAVTHPETGSDAVHELLRRLSDHVGVDFTQYRQGTLLRRIDRRRELLKLHDMDEYVAYAVHSPDELDALHQLFMISWSWCFRDASAWQRLRFEFERDYEHGRDREYVVWVPGCAAGEEAYTIAMLLASIAPERPARVIGSDINATAITKARIGRFPTTVMRDAPAGFMDRFTEVDGETLRMSEPIRAMCEFREEDALTSMPQGPFDLVSCRNLLIYLRTELQDPLLQRIHDALRPGALLFLGLSESLSRNESARYRVVDTTSRIYRRKAEQ